jgi:O-antigen ligase
VNGNPGLLTPFQARGLPLCAPAMNRQCLAPGTSVTARRPGWLLALAAAFAVSTYLGAIHISDFPLAENPENVVGVLLAVAFALTRLWRVRLWFGPARFFIVYFTVTAIITVARYMTERSGGTGGISELRAYAQFAQAFLLFLIYYDLARDPRALRWWAGTFVVTTILLSLVANLGLGGAVGAAAVSRGAAERVGVLGMNLNYQGFLYAAAITGLLCRAITRWPRFGWRDWLLAGGAASMLLALLQTGSRGGLATLVAGVGAALFLMFRGRRWAAYALLVPLILYGVGSAIMSSEVMRYRIFDETLEEGRLGARDVLARESGTMLLEHPWTGWGTRYIEELGARVGKERIAAHNTYLQVATSFGMLGFIPWLLGLGATGWRLWRQRRDFKATALLAIYCALLVAMVPGNYAYGHFAWMFLAVAGAVPLQNTNPRACTRPVSARPKGAPASARGRPLVYGAVRHT